MFMQDTYWRNKLIRRSDKRRRKTSLTNIFTSHFIARVQKGCVGFYCERELETEHNWNIWPHCYDRHIVSSLLFDAQPEA